MQRTSIEWVRNRDGTQGRSVNPIRARHKETGKVGWHCDKVSPGCAHCYAEVIDQRFGTGEPYSKHGGANVELFLDEKPLQSLVRLKAPQTVFPCDMTDLFQDAVPTPMIDKIMAYFTLAKQHTFLLLTKRAARMANYFRRENMWGAAEAYLDLVYGKDSDARLGDGLAHWPPRNVWPGVSVENQDVAESRIVPLLAIHDTRVRFLSVEPLLSAVDLRRYLPGLGWVICGGESGRHARPMDPVWARAIRDQCVASNVPYFFKQWGEWAPRDTPETIAAVNKNHESIRYPQTSAAALQTHLTDWGDVMVRTGKKAAGRLLDGKLWDQFPEALGLDPVTKGYEGEVVRS